MNLVGYECPECDAYSRSVDGYRTKAGVSVKCPACGNVETVRRIPPTEEVAP